MALKKNKGSYLKFFSATIKNLEEKKTLKTDLLNVLDHYSKKVSCNTLTFQPNFLVI